MTGAATRQPAAPPASVVIHDLDQARRVLTAARRTDCPVQLISAPGAAGYLGPALFKQIVDQARAAEPAARATACLDCADEPGSALDALRHGLDAVSLTAAPEVLARIESAAAQAGGRLTRRPDRTLDMADADAERRLDAWLLGDSDLG
jgi:fructose/tagatose bisphosphate aldolase